MGWTITNGYGTGIWPSYIAISTLTQHLAHVLPSRDWRQIRPIFDRPSGDPFDVAPATAHRAAQILRRAAADRRMPREWGDFASQLADAADDSTANGLPWQWS